MRLFFSVKPFTFLQREVHLLSEQHLQIKTIYSFAVQLCCGIWDCFEEAVGCEMCEDCVWKGREWESRLVPQNYTLAEVQLNQKSPSESKVLFGSRTWEHLVSLLQVCPSKWDVDTLDKLTGQTNKEGAEMMVKCLGNVKQWWQDLFFVWADKGSQRGCILSDKPVDTISSRPC